MHLAVLLLASVLISPAAAESYPALAAMRDGRIVSVESGEGERVLVRGEEGILSVSADALTLPVGDAAYVNERAVFLRGEASEAGEKLTLLRRGEAVRLCSVEGAWCLVRLGRQRGYVPADSLALRRAEVERPMGEAMAELAMEYLDVPYVYACSDPERGFDCSGFIYYLASRFGLATWRTAADIYKNDGAEVERGELETGDLVFFHSNTERVGHVGMYIGEGFFIHASSGGGKVVISSLENDYYDRNYVGAKRLDV